MPFDFAQGKQLEKVDIIWVGLTAERQVLEDRIKQRVEKRAKQGMTAEVKRLMREYADSVIAIFILHDNTAKRASGFNEYFSASINGGTVIATAYQLVNKIVEDEGFERDYNIYVFHGTDGDDWDTKGEASVPAIKKCLTYVNRLGITIVGREGTVFEKVIKDAKFITESPKEFRMDVLPEDSDQKKIGEGIRKLVSL